MPAGGRQLQGLAGPGLTLDGGQVRRCRRTNRCRVARGRGWRITGIVAREAIQELGEPPHRQRADAGQQGHLAGVAGRADQVGNPSLAGGHGHGERAADGAHRPVEPQFAEGRPARG